MATFPQAPSDGWASGAVRRGPLLAGQTHSQRRDWTWPVVGHHHSCLHPSCKQPGGGGGGGGGLSVELVRQWIDGGGGGVGLTVELVHQWTGVCVWGGVSRVSVLMDRCGLSVELVHQWIGVWVVSRVSALMDRCGLSVELVH